MNFSQWLAQLDFSRLLTTFITVAAAVLCITVHETCHGLAALKLGDPTAKHLGRLTLNPLKHVDIPGLIMMALFHFGWAKPVPIDPRYFKNPKKGMAITALAGPLSNVVLGFLALVLALLVPVTTGLSGAWEYLYTFLSCTAMLSCGLAVFNLIPIPPLDGSKILFSLLPDAAYEKLLRCEKYGMIVLFVLLWTNVLDTPLLLLRNGLLSFLHQAAALLLRLILSL